MARRSINTQEEKVGQEQVFDLPACGPVGELVDEIETVDTPHWESKAEMESFMEEVVQVRIADTGGVNEEQFIDVKNNGRTQMIRRGVWQNVKRKYVEVLARAKRDNITTNKYTDASGNDSTRIIKAPVLKYPFEMRDRNPDGHVWLQRVLAEV